MVVVATLVSSESEPLSLEVSSDPVLVVPVVVEVEVEVELDVAVVSELAPESSPQPTERESSNEAASTVGTEYLRIARW